MSAEIGLVQDDKVASSLLGHGHAMRVFGRKARIHDFKNDIGLLQFPPGTLHAVGFDEVTGMLAQARGIDEHEGQAVDVEHLLDRVARGASLMTDDGALKACEEIEQR